MVKKCDYCGEVKLCTLTDWNMGGKGSNCRKVGGQVGLLEWFNYICAECKLARDYIVLEQEKILKIKEKKRQLAWIKKRDQILDKNNLFKEDKNNTN